VVAAWSPLVSAARPMATYRRLLRLLGEGEGSGPGDPLSQEPFVCRCLHFRERGGGPALARPPLTCCSFVAGTGFEPVTSGL